MKVCIIVEGTYPYITGGVSSWIQMLIENLPGIQFDVVHLAPWRWKRPFGYKMPKNLNRIYEYLLFSEGDTSNKFVDTNNLVLNVRKLIDFPRSKKADLFSEILKDVAGKNLYSAILTKEFWDFITDIYSHYFESEGFTSFYWTVIGFIIPIIGAIQSIPPKADIYHSTTTGYASLSALVGKYIYNGKLIITEHGIYHREREIEIMKSRNVQEVYKPVWIEIFKLISEVAYKECDALTTLFEKNQLFQLELNADFEKMYVIPNGIDVDKFSKVNRVVHETFNIGMVGRVVPIKDILTAIKAFSIVAKEMENARLYIIGPNDEDEEYYQKCVELIDLLELNDKVIFTGKANVLDYYGLIDVLLLSSVSEGQPLVQLESMACGIPVVVTNVGNCAEIALDPDGQSGFVVEPKDYINMSEKILELAKNKDLWHTFSENGKRIVREKYTLSKMIKSYLSLYEEVLKNG
ncbi:GT4 family glycosyltransferase PelF [Fervidobacterium sp. 2310opik-2]|uniref:GT4 family glycosyltransferase PelF n=1 Tax=Fervidobacterium sp. 2310opik-2 TaxID=1755815 RepID=UPI0013DEE6F2|nr:GT4 family glycosyltransferase PelF [Fervidobacterium sp. 2310opik-2]KAF2962538.1 glycosyl transferase family 1 [Fervidobacterium sp. 2310opik-2]